MERRNPWVVVIGVVALSACGYREPAPAFHANDARFGRLRGSDEPPTTNGVCQHWTRVVIQRDEWAVSHVSFPESAAQDACFTPVTHVGREVHAAAPPRGCSYPDSATRERLEALACALDALAADPAGRSGLFPCTLTSTERSSASRQNARALRAIARRGSVHPYAAVVVPGEGGREQADTALADFLPGDACRELARGDLGRLAGMPLRAARGADAVRGAVAPAVIVSGGAVHSRVIEAFALMHLLQCREHVDPERILVEPCAEHTHTNLRNSGRWLHAMGGRAAYLLTDDGIQSDYFQDSSLFELIMGSVDQRSLRDWGYLLGSWRQASSGIDAGFWYTPYRFWAEPRDGLGSVTCVDEP